MKPATTMTAAEFRKAVKADATPAPRRRMTAREFRAVQGAEDVLPVRPAKPREERRISLRLQVISEANSRDHWTKRSARASRQKQAVREAWIAGEWPVGSKPSQVLLVRKGLQPIDSDNLAGAFKAVRDAIAKLCGCDDGPDGPSWSYGQFEAKDDGVRIWVVWP